MAQIIFFPFSLIFFLIPTLFTEAHAFKQQLHKHHHHHHHHGSSSVEKIFVFGDSYADTGNYRKSVPGPWKEPYGIIFPGKPAGRFSDGRVLTDYIASYLGTKSPISYTWRKSVNSSELQHGMNFAHGGTGVFNTLVDEPNMTTQVQFFQQLVEEKVYTKHELNSSIALVSLAGNDYATYLIKNGDLQGLPALTKSIIKQLAANLKVIFDMGVPKIAVTGMEPMGCLPQLAAFSSYKNCSETWNLASRFHNQLLLQEVQKFNNESKKPVVYTLDLYSAFMSAFTRQENHSGNLELKISLEPCCVGVSDNYLCGNVDKNGEKKYKVCKNPESSFFWDNIHPAQNGWHAVFSALRSSLQRLQ